MVEFSRYVEIGYRVARSRDWYSQQMEGPGTQNAHRNFMSQLAEAYNERNHRNATERQAEQFLEANVGPPAA